MSIIIVWVLAGSLFLSLVLSILADCNGIFYFLMDVIIWDWWLNNKQRLDRNNGITITVYLFMYCQLVKFWVMLKIHRPTMILLSMVNNKTPSISLSISFFFFEECALVNHSALEFSEFIWKRILYLHIKGDPFLCTLPRIGAD